MIYDTDTFSKKQKINYENVQPRHTALPLVFTWDTKQLSVFKIYYFCISYKHTSSPLVAGLSRDRIPVQVRFSATVQTSPGVHPASYTIGATSFPQVKQQMHGVN